MFYTAACVHFGLIRGVWGGGAWPGCDRLYESLPPPVIFLRSGRLPVNIAHAGPNRALHGHAQVLPTQNYVGTAWAGPSTAHALCLPTLLPGHARLGPDRTCPIICLGMLQLWQAQSIAWACPIGHAQAGGRASPSTWAAVGLAHPLPNQRGPECGKPKSAHVQPESSPCKMLTG